MNRLQKLGMPLGGVELNDEVDREDREGLFGCGATESASGRFSWYLNLLGVETPS